MRFLLIFGGSLVCAPLLFTAACESHPDVTFAEPTPLEVPEPLRVAGVFPTNGRSNAVRTEPVSAVFTRELLASTVNASTFILNGPTGSPVAGSVISSGAVATFVPAQPLDPGKAYTAVLSSAITDTDGRNLTNAGAWSFGTATTPAWHVYKTADQAGVGTTPVTISWDSVEYDFADSFDNANDLIAIADSGLYIVGVSLTFGSVADAVGIQIELFKNGSPLKRFQTQPSAGVHNLCFGGSVELQLQTGDTLAIRAAGSTGTQTALQGQALSYFWGRRVE